MSSNIIISNQIETPLLIIQFHNSKFNFHFEFLESRSVVINYVVLNFSTHRICFEIMSDCMYICMCLYVCMCVCIYTNIVLHIILCFLFTHLYQNFQQTVFFNLFNHYSFFIFLIISVKSVQYFELENLFQAECLETNILDRRIFSRPSIQ